jgi:hypothetical protein
MSHPFHRATLGPGKWSLDNAVGIDLNGPAGFVISLVGGIAAAGLVLGATYRPPAPAPAPASSDDAGQPSARTCGRRTVGWSGTPGWRKVMPVA